LTIRTLTLAVALLTTVAAVAETTYTVHRGDSLEKISKRLGVSIDALRKANGLEAKTHLRKGQVLTVPAKPIGTAEVVCSPAIPHAGPFDGSKRLDEIALGTSLPALDQKPGWIRLQLPSGSGWLNSDFVTFTAAPKPIAAEPTLALRIAKPTVHAAKSTSTDDVVKHIASSDNSLLKKALAYRGVRYRWGGTSRSSGVDCSGFTTSVFLSQGIKLPRTSIEQSQIGNGVSKSDLKPGDLVFFRTGRSYRVNHVGIYVGEGKFIHAATGAGHVMVSSLDEKYYLRCYATARRVADVQAASRAAAVCKAASLE
jgi:cell wall-associated NlpC family hydrolase